jgi:hypothetical protein
MIAAATSTATSSPLSALVWVFGSIGGLSVVLVLTSMALAARHRGRRRQWVAAIGRSNGLESAGSADRILTSGDLVRDGDLRRLVLAEAEKLRQRRLPPPDPPPARSGGA